MAGGYSFGVKGDLRHLILALSLPLVNLEIKKKGFLYLSLVFKVSRKFKRYIIAFKRSYYYTCIKRVAAL